MPVSTRTRRRTIVVGDCSTATTTTTSRYFQSNAAAFVTEADSTAVSIVTTRRTRRRLLSTSTSLEAASSVVSMMEDDQSQEPDDKETNADEQVRGATTKASKSKKKTTPRASVKKPRSTSTPRRRSAASVSRSTTRTPTNSANAPQPAAPKDWKGIYALVEELRQDRTAPVDTDGGEELPETKYGPATFRFQVLIALMLSSQTKDAIVGEAMRGLQEHGLTVQKIAQTSPEVLDSLIYRVGFHNNKTKYIKQTVDILQRDYDCDIPPNAEALMKLPGVGPKMAYIVENVAWNVSSGIGIDTHMHRIFNELQWVKTKSPEQTRKQLEAWLPKEYWTTVNKLWVGFGQEVQQQKPKVIRKALACSRPAEALRLLKRLGVDVKKEGAKMGIEDEIKHVMAKGYE